jgi:hypothetical protein
MGYAELLKEPRWQKKRLEIMERDEWTCQTCGDTKATLTVHHKSYRQVDGKFVDIWDYPGDDLITLCEECHSKEESDLNMHKKNMFFAMRGYCENAETMLEAVRVFKAIESDYSRRVTIDDIRCINEFIKTTFKRNAPPCGVDGLSMSEMLEKLMGGKNED